MLKFFVMLVLCLGFVGCTSSPDIVVRDMWRPSSNYASLDQTRYYLNGEQVWGPEYNSNSAPRNYFGPTYDAGTYVPANGPYASASFQQERYTYSYKETSTGWNGMPVHTEGEFQGGSATLSASAGAGTQGPYPYGGAYSYKDSYSSRGRSVVVRPR